MNYTTHTPKDILSAQADCPADLSLDKVITFAHMRSGGSLQWLNILQGLHSRTLNLRCPQVQFLVSQAIFQVGPFDLNTGTWMSHQELQESPFCNALLDELESLLEDVGASLMERVLMNTISLLLTWVLASSPREDISDQAIALLRSVCRTPFHWVQELLYDLVMEPTNQEHSNLLFDMAASCRSTFDVDPAILHKFFHSAEDIDALLSCAFFIYTLRSHNKYSRLLFQCDCQLSLSIEWTLRDVILADASDYSVDLAVSKIFASYRPSVHSWNHLQYPHNCWLTCESEATTDQPKQTVHINLCYRELRVAGQQLSGLLDEIRNSPEFRPVFRDVCPCAGSEVNTYP